MKGNKGMTLMELLVIIAIIGILAALIAPNIALWKEKAKAVKCINNQRQLGIAFKMFAIENENWLPECGVNNEPHIWARAIAPYAEVVYQRSASTGKPTYPPDEDPTTRAPEGGWEIFACPSFVDSNAATFFPVYGIPPHEPSSVERDLSDWKWPNEHVDCSDCYGDQVHLHRGNHGDGGRVWCMVQYKYWGSHYCKWDEVGGKQFRTKLTKGDKGGARKKLTPDGSYDTKSGYVGSSERKLLSCYVEHVASHCHMYPGVKGQAKIFLFSDGHVERELVGHLGDDDATDEPDDIPGWHEL